MGTGGGQPWVSLAKGMPFVMSKEKCQLALMSLRHVGELLPGTRPWRALDAGHSGEEGRGFFLAVLGALRGLKPHSRPWWPW